MSPMSSNESIINTGILGTGKMGLAIAEGALKNHPERKLFACDLNPPQSHPESLEFVSSPEQLESVCDVIIIAVKPVDLKEALKNFKGNKKYISVVAGVSIDSIQSMIHSSEIRQIARAMPNLSALIGEGVTGIYSQDADLLEFSAQIFSGMGTVVPVKSEDLMHAITGLSGSGPAYVFSFIQALAEGGVHEGIAYDASLEIAIQTVLGAARLLQQTHDHPDHWRNRVTSPGGTTISGLKALEKGAFHNTVMNAVIEAAQKSRGLGT